MFLLSGGTAAHGIIPRSTWNNISLRATPIAVEENVEQAGRLAVLV